MALEYGQNAWGHVDWNTNDRKISIPPAMLNPKVNL